MRAVDRDRGTRAPVDYAAAPFARAIGRLVLTKPGDAGSQKNCTLTLLAGETHALTARHCLFADRGEGAEESPLRGPYWIAFGYQRGDWRERAELVITGEDLFASGAVQSWPALDVALVRLPRRFATGRLKTRYGRLSAEITREVTLRDGLGRLSGLRLAAAPKTPGAKHGVAARQGFVHGLYTYSADREIGRRHAVLCADEACRAEMETHEAGAGAVWLGCAGYPGGSGGPYLRSDAMGVYVAGMAIEAEHVSRRTRVVLASAFRAEVEAAMSARVAPPAS